MMEEAHDHVNRLQFKSTRFLFQMDASLLTFRKGQYQMPKYLL